MKQNLFWKLQIISTNVINNFENNKRKKKSKNFNLFSWRNWIRKKCFIDNCSRWNTSRSICLAIGNIILFVVVFLKKYDFIQNDNFFKVRWCVEQDESIRNELLQIWNKERESLSQRDADAIGFVVERLLLDEEFATVAYDRLVAPRVELSSTDQLLADVVVDSLHNIGENWK